MTKHFGLKDNRVGWFEPKAAIFPGYLAPVIRMDESGELELSELNWGFVRRPRGKAPARTTNARDDTIQKNMFWVPSFRERRCLVPFTSYAEPLGEGPAQWWWHAFKEEDDARPLGAFAGVWKTYTGPVKKDGPDVTQDVFAFMTTGSNGSETAEAHGRMPVLLRSENEFATWLRGSEDEAFALAKPYPQEEIAVVQRGNERKDLLLAA